MGEKSGYGNMKNKLIIQLIYSYFLVFIYIYINIYYTPLLNAVERSIHLHGPSRLPAVNYFLIMTVDKHITTAVRKVDVYASDACLSYHSASSQ